MKMHVRVFVVVDMGGGLAVVVVVVMEGSEGGCEVIWRFLPRMFCMGIMFRGWEVLVDLKRLYHSLRFGVVDGKAEVITLKAATDFKDLALCIGKSTKGVWCV